MHVGDAAFQNRLVTALHDDPEFVRETRWFDGSILLEVGDQRCWMKIYRGRVLDTLDFVPPFGYTFKLSGAAAAWDTLVAGQRTFTDLVTAGTRHPETVEQAEREGGGRPPEIAIEGNQFEAGRLHIGVVRLANVLAASAR